MSKVLTPKFRVAFPNVFRARRNDLNGKDEYSLVALFPKDADLTALKAAAQDAIIKKFGEDKSKWPQNMRNPFRDQGDRAKKDQQGNEFLPDGFEPGAIYLTLRSNQRPDVVDQSVQSIIDESEFYGGCWARASISAYAYDTKGNRGVSFGLGNVQKVADDDAFGNKSKAEDDFAPVEGAKKEAPSQKSASDLFS